MNDTNEIFDDFLLGADEQPAGARRKPVAADRRDGQLFANEWDELGRGVGNASVLIDASGSGDYQPLGGDMMSPGSSLAEHPKFPHAMSSRSAPLNVVPMMATHDVPVGRLITLGTADEALARLEEDFQRRERRLLEENRLVVEESRAALLALRNVEDAAEADRRAYREEKRKLVATVEELRRSTAAQHAAAEQDGGVRANTVAAEIVLTPAQVRLGLDESKMLPEEKEQLLALAKTLAQKVTTKVHEGTSLAQLRDLVRQILLHCVTEPGGDIFAALLTETTLHDDSMVTVRNRSALEAGVKEVLEEMALTRKDLEALEDDGNEVGANPRDNELRQDQLRGSKVLNLDRRLKKLSTICINHVRACMDPEFAKKFVSCSSFIALVAQLFGKKGDGWAIHAKEATAALSKPSPLGVTVHTTLVDVADDLLRDIQGRLIRLS